MNDLFAFDGFIYKKTGVKLKKIEDKTVLITVDKKERRFIYDKLYNFIIRTQNNKDLIQVIEKVKLKIKHKEPKIKQKRKRNYNYVKKGYSTHKAKSIICLHPNGTEQEFESVYEAHRQLGMRRMTIHSLLKGNVHKKEIYKFYYKQ